MGSQRLMKAMKDSISKVFETMFFKMVQISKDNYTLAEWLGAEQDVMGATLALKGPLSATVYLMIPRSFMEEITADFLGLDPQRVKVGKQGDTIKEALNMIGGGMLSILDKKGVFKLGIPELLTDENLGFDALQDAAEDIFLLETEKDRLATVIVLN